jgi:hypothetical protein
VKDGSSVVGNRLLVNAMSVGCVFQGSLGFQLGLKRELVDS